MTHFDGARTQIEAFSNEGPFGAIAAAVVAGLGHNFQGVDAPVVGSHTAALALQNGQGGRSL